MTRIKAFIALLLLVPALCFAQFVIKNGQTTAPSQVQQNGMPAGKIYVNLSTFPKKQPDSTGFRYRITCTGTITSCDDGSSTKVPHRYTATSGLGAYNAGSFRIVCAFSHVAFDDPIFFPGQAGRTHLHQFFGNGSTRSVSDLNNMATTGNSTCTGGTFNRTGYWAPVLVYHCPAGSTNGCTQSRDGEVHTGTSANFYYKCAESFACDTSGYGGTALRWWPAGFRMIAGDPLATAPQAGTIALWRCNLADQSTEEYRGSSIPTAAQAVSNCTDLEISITFPMCWDGVNLDSPVTHKAHVAYEDFYNGCTNALFPVLTPQIGLNIHTTIPNADIPYMRLSSDPPLSSGQAAGLTAHADWVNGWDQTTIVPEFGMSITQAIIQECYMVHYSPAPLHSDCHDHLLGSPKKDGNWWTLY